MGTVGMEVSLCHGLYEKSSLTFASREDRILEVTRWKFTGTKVDDSYFGIANPEERAVRSSSLESITSESLPFQMPLIYTILMSACAIGVKHIKNNILNSNL